MNPPRIHVAIVAPSLRILGGQSVQADRLLRGWQSDPEVEAWLVPHNPWPPRPLRAALRVKYLRTVVTELTYLRLLVRELAKADIVHVFSASYSSFLLAPLPAMMVARALGKPVLLNYHSGEAPDHLARSRVARAALRLADRVVVPSAFLASVFSQFDIPTTVVPNTIDLDQFTFTERRPLRPRILSTRNLGYPYNVACTLRAFREVLDCRPDARLTVVGGGADEPALRALARDLDLTAVHFAGQLRPEDMAAAYADHDLYVQSPDIDNMPLSVLEAFASGLPAVSTDVGGVRVLIEHGERGLMAPPGDHRTLASHLLRLLDQPDYARQLARAARQSCDAYAWPAVRARWNEAYRTLLSEKGASRADRSSGQAVEAHRPGTLRPEGAAHESGNPS